MSKYCIYIEADIVKRVEFTDQSIGAIIGSGVKGLFQYTALSPNLSLWTNEEGKLHNLPVNRAGTLLWEKVYGTTDIIVGPIVLTGGNTEEGEIDGLTERQIKDLTTLVSSI